MHELSIANGILDIVHEYVPLGRRSAVRAVHVRIGALSGVVPESLAFSFAALVADSALSHASLAIEHVPIRIHCNRCGHEFATDAPIFLCPRCESGDTSLLQGNELQVVEIELEDQPVESS
jgi:hydrogenase nickel incorporation protein HypA/HybF